MRPDDRELDEEIRGHMALSVRERIEQGEDPEAARLAALREFGYVPAIRDSMRRVWYSRWFDAAAALGQDMRVAFRSLRRAKGLAATVVVTLALGIGANAAIFSVVRGVLHRPLVNRGEDRLIYIRQSAPGLGDANTTFSVPEIDDFKSAVTTISALRRLLDGRLHADRSRRTARGAGGGRGGSFFEVMGLRPVLGRLLNDGDDGPNAAGVVVFTHRFWTASLNSDPSVVGKSIRLGSRTATVVGVLEPSVPYPADTEIIANVVTSPHHLGATMTTLRTHRMTELFGRLVPGASVDDARTELKTVHGAMVREHPEAYSASANIQLSVRPLRDQLTAPARTILLVLLAAAAVVFVIACSNVANLILARSVRREGELAVRAALGASQGALRRTLLAESLVLCGAGAVLGVALARPLVAVVARLRRALLCARARGHGRQPACCGSAPASRWPPPCCSRTSRGFRRPHAPTRARAGERQRPNHAGHQPPPSPLRHDPDCVLIRAARRRWHAARRARRPADGRHRLQHAAGAGARRADTIDRHQERTGDGLLRGGDEAHRQVARCGRRRARELRAVARRRQIRFRLPVHRRRLHAGGRRREPAGPDANGHASVLCGARCAAARRTRFHRRRPHRHRAGGDRQPERGATIVPGRQRDEPQAVVDRSAASGNPSRDASSVSSPTWTTRTSFKARRSRSITRSSRCGWPAACSCTRPAILTHSCRR